mgnify:FL=1
MGQAFAARGENCSEVGMTGRRASSARGRKELCPSTPGLARTGRMRAPTPHALVPIGEMNYRSSIVETQ